MIGEYFMINQANLIKLLYKECDQLEERCPGYTQRLCDEVREIVMLENEHKIKATPIIKEIEDRCQRLGKFLASRQA